MSTFQMRCFGCKRELGDAMPSHLQPSDGVVFRSQGNFGSRVFDCNGGTLLLFVCDECVTGRVEEMVGRREHRPMAEYSYHPAREILEQE